MSTLLSAAAAAAASCSGCFVDCWPLFLGTFIIGSWFGVLIMGLLIGASRRIDP